MLAKRRKFLLGGGALAAGAVLLRPSDKGEPYSKYFSRLNQRLRDEKIAQPRMILDLRAIDANIDAITASIRSPKQWRIVVKSLPSIELLEYIMKRSESNALMVFHQPFLNRIAQRFPNSDLLLGKPLPVNAAEKFYTALNNTEFRPDNQLQWLIDSELRLRQYQQLAQANGVKMRISLELDIGLHRGGFDKPESLLVALNIIADDPQHLELAGFMGYEAFIAKLPNTASRLADAKQSYHNLLDAARQQHAALFGENMTFNIAGSQTYTLYEDDDFFNDISAGSGVVMPTDFDMDTLAHHKPASYIAAPVLKHYNEVRISGVEALAPVFSAWNPNRQQAWYLYGGNWQAEYESPEGLIRNPIWGYSSNQEMVNGSDNINLNVDDFVFLRPRQSEFVFLQFGDLIAVRDGQMESLWPVLGDC